MAYEGSSEFSAVSAYDEYEKRVKNDDGLFGEAVILTMGGRVLRSVNAPPHLLAVQWDDASDADVFPDMGAK